MKHLKITTSCVKSKTENLKSVEGTVYHIHWEQCDKEYVGETFIKNSSKGTYHNLELLSSFYLLDLINLQLIDKNSDNL